MAEQGFVRHRTEGGAGGYPGCHPGRDVLPRLAGITRQVDEAGGTRNPRRLIRVDMADPHHGQCVSAVFITFSGNCKKALTHYQSCFGGDLQFELFGKTLRSEEHTSELQSREKLVCRLLLE